MHFSDRELLRDLARRVVQNDPQIADRAKTTMQRGQLEAYVENIQKELGGALEGMGGGIDEELAFETIVVREGRPVLLVENNDYRLEGPESEVWKDRLDSVDVRKAIRSVIPAVGRIEVANHPSYTWVGTGWLADDDVIVTNRHVAELFAVRSGERFVFRKGWPDPASRMAARVDFIKERNSASVNEFAVLDILHIEDDFGPDLAFLKVNKKSTIGTGLSGKLRFATSPGQDKQFVATIGYPAADSRVPDQDLVRKLFGDVYNVKRMAPGQLLKPRDGLVLHDCSTLGGNSGSPIVDLSSGEAIGLHFSGLFMRENRGVPAAIVKDRLEKVRSGIRVAVPDTPFPRQAQKNDAGLQSVRTPSANQQRVRLDVTVPIEVIVNVGTPVVANHPGEQASTVEVQTTFVSALEQAKANFSSMTGVMSVRAGYVFQDGWITDDQSIVVTVPASTDDVARRVPESISGFPVQVRLASPLDYLESMDLIESLEGFPRTTYTPPDDVSLEPVEEEMKVICHLCPDAGWPMLREFLAETKKRLAIGMYDFTAPHITEAVLSATEKQSKKLSLVLQQKASLGGGTKKFDIPEEETIARYVDKLGSRFDFAWASVGKNHRFASAYHIKVAVRDGKAFWLSSGNWQSSNQPDHEIATKDDGWNLLMKHNREWNIVVENTELASQFESFLKHDLKQARADENIESAELPTLEFFVEEAPELERIPSGPPTYFEPLVVERSVRVQPLLTPDNYQQQVLKFIESAEEQILFQNQSFSILDDPKNDSRYESIFTALLEKQKSGVDVRIIIRGDFGPEQIVERLKTRGFDTDRIRLQNRCHTKGIIIDRSAVLVGSHNWTNQGTLVNRDASLIFYDEEIAEYFAKTFWFDWKNMARKSVAGARRVRIADNDEAPPSGTVKLSLYDVIC